MFNFKILENVDNEEWLKHLSKSEYTTFYQTAEHLKSDSSRHPLFVYVYDENHQVKGQLAMTILKKQSAYSTPFLKKYMKTISKLGNRGVWVSGPIIHSDDKKTRLKILSVFLKALDKIATKYNLVLLDGYSPPQDLKIDEDYKQVFKKNGYRIEKFVTFVFDMKLTIDELWKNVKKYTRINVKRAPKRGIKIIELSKKIQLKEYYDLENEWAKTKGLGSSKDYPNLDNDWQKIKSGFDKIFLAYQDNELISAVSVSYFNKIVSPTKVLSSYSKATSLGGPALTWHAIKWTKENGMRIYDLTGGKAEPDNREKKERYEKQWSSLLSYKRKWGGDEYSYFHFVKVKKGMSYKILKLLAKPDLFYRGFKKSKFKIPKNLNII